MQLLNIKPSLLSQWFNIYNAEEFGALIKFCLDNKLDYNILPNKTDNVHVLFEVRVIVGNDYEMDNKLANFHAMFH